MRQSNSENVVIQKVKNNYRTAITNIEKALIIALGGPEWMSANKEIVTKFSPNNIRAIHIGLESITVMHHIAPVVKTVKIPPATREQLNGNKDTTRALNRILQKRKMSGLEEVYIHQEYFERGYIDPEQLMIALSGSISRQSIRLRVLASYTEYPDQYFQEAMKIKGDNVRVLIKEIMQEKTGTDFFNVIYENPDLHYGVSYNLDATHYAMDVKNGPLYERLYEIQQALNMIMSAKYLEPYVIKDLEQSEMIKRIDQFIKKNTKDGNEVIRVALKEQGERYRKPFTELTTYQVKEILKNIHRNNPKLFKESSFTSVNEYLNILVNNLMITSTGNIYHPSTARLGRGVFEGDGLFQAHVLLQQLLNRCNTVLRTDQFEKAFEQIQKETEYFFDRLDFKDKEIIGRISLEELLGILEKVSQLKIDQDIKYDPLNDPLYREELLAQMEALRKGMLAYEKETHYFSDYGRELREKTGLKPIE